jgi:hypothetical protein
MTLLLALLPAAQALSLSLVSEQTLTSGILLRKYRTSSPSTNTWVAVVNLCRDGVYLDATRAADSTQSTGSWANGMGVDLAVNGDFYRTDPLRVYGDAIGGGVRWPLVQTGVHSDYAGEWYYHDYGWVAFGHDWVDYTHTGWVKNNASIFGGLAGWDPGTVAPAPRPGTLALVSGFPELVVEGRAMTCADPEASSCFPDRGDMRDRHPRTAIGLTEDLSQLLLVVVDGRTSSSSGMYGSELADLMSQLGAWIAFNHDGGGSSQMWADGEGYLNDVEGNNSGSSARSVANHWGVYAGGNDGLPARPGHCATASPCATIPADGATVDNADTCWRGFGDPDYWRTETGGVGGRLRWTNAFRSSSPDNWAWWQLHFAEAGTYRVEVSVDATWSVHEAVRYEVRHDGGTDTVTIDPTAASSWATLGTWDFAEGGDQWVAVFDNVTSGSVASGQHIVADAVRVTRVDPYCGDGACTEDERCAGCDDCPPAGDEVAGNGVDDDCDGSVDERPADTGGNDTGSVDTGWDTGPAPDTASADTATPWEPTLPGEPEMLGSACGCSGVRSATPGASLGMGAALLAALGTRRRRDRPRS